MKIQPLDPLPPFRLPAAFHDEKTEKVLSNADFAGRPFVLFVYPRDATSGCTLEAQGFRDAFEEFENLGMMVVGLSRDKIGAHQRFIRNEALPYPLLADDGGKLLRSWGLLKDATMYGKSVTKVARTTFFVDEKGKIQKIWENVVPAGHAEAVLEWVRERLTTTA